MKAEDIKYICKSLDKPVPETYIETGCGKGSHLYHISDDLGIDCIGIDHNPPLDYNPDHCGVFLLEGKSQEVLLDLLTEDSAPDHPIFVYLDACWTKNRNEPLSDPDYFKSGKKIDIYQSYTPLLQELDVLTGREFSDIIVIGYPNRLGKYSPKWGDWRELTLEKVLDKASPSRHFVYNGLLVLDMP